MNLTVYYTQVLLTLHSNPAGQFLYIPNPAGQFLYVPNPAGQFHYIPNPAKQFLTPQVWSQT